MTRTLPRFVTLHSSLSHAVACCLANCQECNYNAPYTRVLLKVAAWGKPRCKKSYGGCNQLVYPANQVCVVEVVLFRGVRLCDKGERHIPHFDTEKYVNYLHEVLANGVLRTSV